MASRTASSYVPPTSLTCAPSAAMAATAMGCTPSDTNTCARCPNSRAIRATARPWLPSVAVTSVSTPSAGWRDSTWCTAQDAPRTLNAGKPIRADSSLTSTRPTPSSAARAGTSVSGVGA